MNKKSPAYLKAWQSRKFPGENREFSWGNREVSQCGEGMKI